MSDAKSIESVWESGVLGKNEHVVPRVNDLYKRKSIDVIDKVVRRLSIEVWLLMPMALAMFLLNIFLDNDHRVLWGVVCMLPCLAFFMVGIKQVRSLKRVDFEASCYQHLVSMRQKLREINRFNRLMVVCMAPLMLLPMVLYTYINHRGKTVGEIFGIEALQWSSLILFLLIPVLMLVMFAVWELGSRRKREDACRIDDLIREMDELRS